MLLRNRTRFTAVLLLLATLAPSFARSKPPAVESDYVLALFTANDFLHAWQVQDREAGILLLTDRLKQRTSEDALMNFFSAATPCTQSFEIQRGKKLAPGRYRFPVSLFQKTSSAKRMRSQTSSLVVVKTGRNEWSIDKLP